MRANIFRTRKIFPVSNADALTGFLALWMTAMTMMKNLTMFMTGVELRPFFIKILAWTTFVHFVQSWSQ